MGKENQKKAMCVLKLFLPSLQKGRTYNKTWDTAYNNRERVLWSSAHGRQQNGYQQFDR